MVVSVPELIQLADLYRKPLQYFFDGWCTVAWSDDDNDHRSSDPAEAAKWQGQVLARRKRKRRPLKKLFGMGNVSERT